MGAAQATQVDAVQDAPTLDDATLRQLFADAPAAMRVPRDVRSMFVQRMRAIVRRHRTIATVLGMALVVVAASVAVAGFPVIGAAVLGSALLVAAGIAMYQYGQASDDFFGLYATARGLRHHEGGRMSADVPLFGRGDKRRWPRLLQGTIAARPATLAHYTWTDVTRDRDGRRREHDHHYTVLHFELPDAVAERFAGVYCAPRSLSLGAVQDRLAHDRSVELESAEFGRRYSLRVVDTQDDVSLYELFSTPFVHRLATELEVHWEQRGRDLVVWKAGHETEAADLDRMCLEAWHVLHRYLEEHR